MGVCLFSETQVSISSSSNLATIGDRINLKIIVKTSSDIQKINLVSKKNDFEVISEKTIKREDQKDYIVFEKDFSVAFFKTGEFNIGPFKVELIKDKKIIETKETNSIPVKIKSVLKKVDKDIKPLKDLVDMKGDPFYILKYLFLALAIVLLIVLITIWLKKKNKKTDIIKKPLLSPIEEFELRIRELSEMKLFKKGKKIEFFIRLTEIIKNFLYRKYGFNAEDFTTYETLFRLKENEREVLILNNMEFVFSTSDLVKFAKFVPDSFTFREVISKVGEMISTYKQKIRPQEDLK